MVRIATCLNDKAACKPLFFENAAYSYLMIKQYRKFAFYMQKAANHFAQTELNVYQ